MRNAMTQWNHSTYRSGAALAVFGLIVLILGAGAMIAGAADTDQAKVTGAIQNPGEFIAGYTAESTKVYDDSTARRSERPSHSMVTPSHRVDDRIPQPTWEAPTKVIDVRKEFPQARRAWERILWDPETFRQGSGVSNSELGEYQSDPHFVGRNSVPLRDMEQVVVDIPEAIETREMPMMDMVAHTTARGFMNLTCGWLEVPRHVGIEMRRIDPCSGFALGVVKGGMWGVLRTVNGARELVVGAFDIVRFPFKRPEALDHRIWVKPEWIAREMWAERLPYITDKNEYTAHSKPLP